MAEETKDAVGEATEAPAGNKKKKLIIMVGGGLALLIILGVAAFFLMSGGHESVEKIVGEEQGAEHGEAEPTTASAEVAKESEKPKSEGDKPDSAKSEGTAKAAVSKANAEASDGGFGQTFKFKTFNLNLANPLSNHFVRLEVAVEYLGGDGQKSEIEKRLPQLEDAIVTVTSQKTREFLLGPDGKDQLRREILIRLNRYLTKPLEAVFITDILIE